MAVKYHISLDGIPRPCRARVRPCRFGAANSHFNTLDEAQTVADSLNEQLNQIDGFGIVREEEWVVVNEEVNKTAIKLANIQATVKRLETIKQNTRQHILEQLVSHNVTSIKDEEIGSISFVKGSVRSKADSEKLKADNIYYDHTKTSLVNEHVRVSLDHENRRIANFEQRITNVEGTPFNFEITVDEDGKATLNEETRNGLRKVKEFEDKLKRVQEIEKELSNGLMEAMKQSHTTEINLGGVKVEHIPQHNRMIVDTQSLKESGLYEQYSYSIQTPPTVMLRFKKEA